MIGVLVGIGAFYGLHDIVGVDPASVLLAIGAGALVTAVASLFLLGDARRCPSTTATRDRP